MTVAVVKEHSSSPTTAQQLSITRVANPAAVATSKAKDLFTDTAGTLITAHTADVGGPWIKDVPSWLTNSAGVITDANRIRGNGNFVITRLTGQPATAEFDIDVTWYIASLVSGNVGHAYIPFRLDPTTSGGTYYMAECFFNSSTTIGLRISKVVAGVFTSGVGSAAITISAGGSISATVECRDAYKRIMVGGVEQCRNTDNTITAKGYVGVRFDAAQTNTTGVHVDSLNLKDLPVVVGSDAEAAVTLDKGPVRFGRCRTANGSSPVTTNLAAEAAEYEMMMFAPWRTDLRDIVKAANPACLCLAYKNVSGINSNAPVVVNGRSVWGGGVDYTDADANHDNWFLKNPGGSRFAFNSFAYNWFADIGLASYQTAWAGQVLAELEALGWDGVFMDDVNPTAKYHHTPVTDLVAYPSDAAYGAATLSFLQAVVPTLRTAGKAVMCNLGSWHEYHTVVDGWWPLVDIMCFNEGYGSFAPDTYVFEGGWDLDQSSAAAVMASGKRFFATGYSASDSSQAIRYGYASMLLIATAIQSGRVAASQATHHDVTNEPIHLAEMDYAIGQPTGAYTGTTGQVRKRAFTNGLVCVNPTSGTLTATFGGTYSGCGLTSQTSASMAANTALILTTG